MTKNVFAYVECSSRTDENIGEVFQKAVEQALKKRLQEADEEYEFLMKENADKKKSRSEQTTQLHETQRLLKLEQRKLKKITEETQAIANERMQLETANRCVHVKKNSV